MKTMKRRLAGAVTADRLGTVIMRLWGPALVVRAGSLWLAVAVYVIGSNGPVSEKERQIYVHSFIRLHRRASIGDRNNSARQPP